MAQDSGRSVTAIGGMATGHARYVGRVGALAMALGVGAAVASMPMAFADTTGTAGSSGASAAASADGAAASPARGASRSRSNTPATRTGGPAAPRVGAANTRAAHNSGAAGSVALTQRLDDIESTPTRSSTAVQAAGPVAVTESPAAVDANPSSAAPVMVAAPRAAASSGTVSVLGGGLAAWLGAGDTGGDSGAQPLAWMTLASTRRELGAAARTAAPATVVSTGEPATLLLAAAKSTPSASASWQPGSILRIFVGNGSADNPDAGRVHV